MTLALSKYVSFAAHTHMQVLVCIHMHVYAGMRVYVSFLSTHTYAHAHTHAQILLEPNWDEFNASGTEMMVAGGVGGAGKGVVAKAGVRSGRRSRGDTPTLDSSQFLG